MLHGPQSAFGPFVLGVVFQDFKPGANGGGGVFSFEMGYRQGEAHVQMGGIGLEAAAEVEIGVFEHPGMEAGTSQKGVIVGILEKIGDLGLQIADHLGVPPGGQPSAGLLENVIRYSHTPCAVSPDRRLWIPSLR